jgi:hypothetical protein
MPKPIDPDERQRIVDLLHEHGGNRTKVANMVKRARQTVCNIADAAGIPVMDSPQTKKAHEARSHFSEERRREIVTKSLEHVFGLMEHTNDPQDAQRLAVAVGILVDKDLLLAGKPTNISESRKGNGVQGLFTDLKGQVDEQWRR